MNRLADRDLKYYCGLMSQKEVRLYPNLARRRARRVAQEIELQRTSFQELEAFRRELEVMQRLRNQ